MGEGGLEPPTSSLSGMRSNHLSYKPKKIRVYDGLTTIHGSTSSNHFEILLKRR